MENDMVSRLNEYMDVKGLNPTSFAREVGIDPSNLKKMLKNEQTITNKTIAKIIGATGINRTWLMTGEGEMLKESKSIPHKVDSGVADKAVESFVPLLPVYAYGGSLNDFATSVNEYDCEKVISPIVGVDFSIQVSGDSMAPEYPNGSRIFIKKINERAFIEWGKTYVLDTCNGTVVKRIIPSEREGYIRCVSINPNPVYAPFEVALADVFGMYKVMLCMSIK